MCKLMFEIFFLDVEADFLSKFMQLVGNCLIFWYGIVFIVCLMNP